MSALRATPGDPTRGSDRTSRVHNQWSKNVVGCPLVSPTVKDQAGRFLAAPRLAARGLRLAPPALHNLRVHEPLQPDREVLLHSPVGR